MYSRLKPIVFSIVLSMLYSLPLLLLSKGNLYGHDLHFHLDRMKGLSHVFESPINFTTFYNNGLGVNFFYPWLTYYPFYVIYQVVGSIQLSWYLYLGIMLVIGNSIAYHSAKGISKSSKIGYIFTVIYLFANYRLDNILVRFATGEILASLFIPLVFWGFYEVTFGDKMKWYILPVGMTLLMYSHILSVALTIAVLVITCFVTFYFWKAKIESIKLIILGSLATLVMSSFVYVPMLEQSLNLKLARPFVNQLTDGIYNLPDFLYYSVKNTVLIDLGNSITSVHVMGVLILLATLMSVLYYIIKRSFRTGMTTYLLIVSLGLITILFIPILWQSLQETPFNIVQFPWRLNGYIILFVSYLFALLLRHINIKWLVLGLCCLILLQISTVKHQYRLYQSQDVWLPWGVLSDKNNYYELTHAVIVSDYSNDISGGTTGNVGEGDVRYLVAQNKIIQNDKVIDARMSYNDLSVKFYLTNSEDNSVKTFLPIYYYLGQEVTVDGKKIESKLSPKSSTEIDLPIGSHQIVVTYHYTKIATISAIISFVSMVIFGSYILYEKTSAFIIKC